MAKKFWITALAFGLPWTTGMIIYNSIVEGGVTWGTIVSTLVGGLVAGFLFAWIMGYTGKKLIKTIVIETLADETIIKEGGANHFKGKEGVGGKLVLTDKRLIFKSHKFNIQNHQENFDLGNVKTLWATRTLRIFENGLTVQLTTDCRHKFVVDEPADWVEEIKNQQRLQS